MGSVLARSLRVEEGRGSRGNGNTQPSTWLRRCLRWMPKRQILFKYPRESTPAPLSPSYPHHSAFFAHICALCSALQRTGTLPSPPSLPRSRPPTLLRSLPPTISSELPCSQPSQTLLRFLPLSPLGSFQPSPHRSLPPSITLPLPLTISQSPRPVPRSISIHPAFPAHLLPSTRPFLHHSSLPQSPPPSISSLTSLPPHQCTFPPFPSPSIPHLTLTVPKGLSSPPSLPSRPPLFSLASLPLLPSSSPLSRHAISIPDLCIPLSRSPHLAPYPLPRPSSA